MAYNPVLPKGQATMANSNPVVLASDQSSIPVAGTFWQSTQPVSLTGDSISNSDGRGDTSLNVLADGSATPLTVLTYPWIFNSSTWDRPRSIINATNSTGTGIAAVGNLAQFDDVSPTSITENQFGNLRMSANRNLYATLRDAAGNERGVNVTSANELLVNVNNTVLPGMGAGATGAAVPANASYDGGIAKTSLPTAATDGNLTGKMVDKFGRTVIMPHGMRDIILPMTQLTLTSTTTETTLITQVASTFLDILTLVVINTSATATQVDFRDSTGGTIRLSLYVPAGDTRGVALNGILPQNTVNNNWTAKCVTSVASIIITGTYITNK